jgi:hypothetical protein
VLTGARHVDHRPDPPTALRFSRAFRGPRVLLRLLQMNVPTSTTADHSNIPDHRIVVGTTAVRLKVARQSRAIAKGPQGQGSRTEPNLDAPRRDCSRRRLCPNPVRFGHLVSRAPFFALSGETWGRERARRHRDCLHDKRDVRVVRRPISAKKPDVHQPEEPSVGGPSRRTVDGASGGANHLKALPAPFSPHRIRTRDARSDSGGSVVDRRAE